MGWLAGAVGLAIVPASAQTPPQPAEIVIGMTVAYTGPNAAYGTIGRTAEAFFRMINEQGGINGRMIRFISYDDEYSPARALEMTRRLVEQDGVDLVFRTVGTPANLAIRGYLNEMQVPQLFVATGAELFDDPANYPWTMRWNGSFRAEGAVYGRYIAETHPGARVGVLYQNDDSGRDYLAGLREGLGAGFEVVEAPYDVIEPTMDPQIALLQAADIDVFANFGSPRFAAQAMRRLGELGWHPPQVQANISSSIAGVIAPAGIENAIGNVTALFAKDPGYSGWDSYPDVIEFRRFMAEYYPAGDPRGVFESSAYATSNALAEVLRRAGDDVSRANIMRVASNIVDMEVPNLVPGILVNTSPTDFAPIEQFMLARFDGTAFVPFGDLIDLGR